LPAKQTTKHVPKPQIPEGAINARGWKKVVDNQTGRVKYVDMKIGAALDSGGDVTHERW
jgi:hypothetical protein